MGFTDKMKKNLEKKFAGNAELNKEALKWKKSLGEVNKKLDSSAKKKK